MVIMFRSRSSKKQLCKSYMKFMKVQHWLSKIQFLFHNYLFTVAQTEWVMTGISSRSNLTTGLISSLNSAEIDGSQGKKPISRMIPMMISLLDYDTSLGKAL